MMKTRKTVAMLTLIAVFALGCIPGCGKEKKMEETVQPVSQEETKKTPQPLANESGFTDLKSFTAETLDGNTFTEADFKDYDVTVLNVWSLTCGPCINEMPALGEFEKNTPENIQLITYCLDASFDPEYTKELLAQAGYEGITLIGGDGDLEKFDHELMYTPTTVFIGSDGNIMGEAIIGASQRLETQYNARINEALEALGK